MFLVSVILNIARRLGVLRICVFHVLEASLEILCRGNLILIYYIYCKYISRTTAVVEYELV